MPYSGSAAPISAHHLPASGCNSRALPRQLAQRRYCAQFFSAKPRETKRLRCQVPTGREDFGGGAAQLNKARVPQRSYAFALPADVLPALVLDLNLGLLAKLCVCIPFLPGKRAAILIHHETPAERDDACLRPPGRPAIRIGWWSDLTRPLFFPRLCFYVCSSCPRALTGETLRRLPVGKGLAAQLRAMLVAPSGPLESTVAASCSPSLPLDDLQSCRVCVTLPRRIDPMGDRAVGR